MAPTTQAPSDKFKVPDAFWKGLKLIGLTPAAVVHHARLPASLYLPDMSERRRVTTEEYFQLWRSVEALASDTGAGIALVTSLNTNVLPPSSLAAFYARDYRDALARTARFKQLCAPERLHIAEDGADCTITVDWWQASSEIPALLIDAAFASFVELGRRATGTGVIPRKVELTRAKDRTGAHAGYFGCTIRFGASRNALVLDVADLDRRFPGHNPEMLEILNPALSAALAEAAGQSSIGYQVKMSLKRILAGGHSQIADVARDLGMSARTLQRRITEEETSFRQLLLEARLDLVKYLLAEPSIEINEVAYLVGYDDVNSFYRAFRTWEGTTPGRWRELQASIVPAP